MLPAGAGATGDALHKTGRGKLSYDLDRIARSAERGEQIRSTSRSYDRASGLVKVTIELREGVSSAGVAAAVQGVGGRIDGTAGNLVSAALPPSSLRSVAAHADVRLMRARFRPHSKKAAALSLSAPAGVISQGVAVIGAEAYRTRTGADGHGVTVGILDGTFKGALELVGSELPEDTLATDFVNSHLSSFPDVHGTACAEIVHDVAPGARIALAAFEDEVSWANAVDELIDKGGAKVISHSIGFDNLFPPDGNNFFSQKVDAASARGVLFVTAAGNEGGNYFQGRWTDTNANGFLEFAPGLELLPIYVGPPSSSVVVRWDDTFGKSNHDYDLLVVRPEFAQNPELSEENPYVVGISADAQKGSENPVEAVEIDEVDQPGILYVVIVHDPASPVNASQKFWVYAHDGIAEPALATAAGSLSSPGDARGAVTVGAVAFDSRQIEGYSSRGPTADGRVKPDVMGPDKVATTSYGAEFPGTSAATPHVAGAAALILSKNPSMNGAALRQALERATTSGGNGKNNDLGLGLIDMSKAP
ncbi:MAG TPA: S8 family serine peptidase [Vicinamibacteria bacterium]|jgi:subtilisin family serine protease|nr:S8 family serine peptidase [Vicinamibacteria bacterium]